MPSVTKPSPPAGSHDGPVALRCRLPRVTLAACKACLAWKRRRLWRPPQRHSCPSRKRDLMTRNSRALPWVAAVGAISLGLAACSGSTGGTTVPGGSGSAAAAVRGGTLNMLGAGDVDYMDPNVSYYSAGYTALRLWSRQLFTYPAQAGQVSQAVPAVATEMPTTGKGVSSDGLTYTIAIRPGAKWNTSPPRQVTAADMVRGVKRSCNPVQPFGGLPDYENLIAGFKAFCDGFANAGKTPAALSAYMEKTPLPGVVAKDDRTVVFTLNNPASYFVDMLTLSAFSPAPKEFD